MELSVPPKARHFSTIGIEDVFLDLPETPHLFPRSYLLDGVSPTKAVTSWEVIGTIKESPEDFVVREIAKQGLTIPGALNDNEREAFRVAELVKCQKNDEANKTLNRDNNATENTDEEQNVNHKKDNQASNSMDDQDDNKQSPREGQNELEPLEIITAVLAEVMEDHDIGKVNEILASFKSLDEKAFERIKSWTEHSNISSETSFDIPQIPTDFTYMENSGKLSGIDRKVFHRSLRLTFPLLQSKTFPENKSVIQISMDDFFHGLIPFLYRPHEDLPKLYRFAKRGCTAPTPKTPIHSKPRDRGSKRKRTHDRMAPDLDLEDDSSTILRLIPDLPKDKRRPIHHMIAQKNRNLQTSTLPTYPLEENSELTTTAIVVRWSPVALKRNRKKRKEATPGKMDRHPNTLCVLKKHGKEHLTAINHLCASIGCRPNDVGLAGIKDMRAITYQFCTLRNISPARLQNAAHKLKGKGIELGTIRRVDFFLQNGDLDGNRFEITVRGLRRVQIEVDSTGQTTEKFVTCDRSHVQKLFERVRRSGFINYYGEQRVGTPGDTSDVGIRTFDVGRAMLQEDFSKAIDLIMTGRSTSHRNNSKENPDEIIMRKTWKESGGDPEATLKVFPKGEAMAREQAVLKGLKRYGKDKPLAAIQCIPNGVRRFWINAYQSYVWNMMASARLKHFGTKHAVLGDLFMEQGSHRNNNVKIVDADNLPCVRIEQVVLPLPGHRVVYPKNHIGELYQKLLNEDNVNFGKESPEEGTAKGAYRHLIAKPENMQLVFKEGAPNDGDNVSTVKLTFDLVAGCYATMLFRELMLTTVARD